MDRPPVALIVGAGDFIGAAIAKRFAAGGYTVAGGRRNAEKLEPLIAEIEAGGGRARGYALDAREEDIVTAVFAEIERDLGPIEVVVYNVGANVNFPIRETTSRVFRKVWEMACYGGFLVGREAARVMGPRGRGSIFFTGATASLRGGKGFADTLATQWQRWEQLLSAEKEHPQAYSVVEVDVHFTGPDGTTLHAPAF